MGQNRIEKIAERFAVDLTTGHQVKAGDFLSIRPRHVLTHDNSGAVIPKFRSIGASGVHDSAQPVFALDHDVQNESPKNLAKYAAIEKFAREQSISFFPAKSGISHQMMLEEGFVLPGTFVVGSDSHSNIYGALGALGTPIVRTDAAAIWATGQTWWQVPEVVRVRLTGKLGQGVTGKDVIIALIGFFKNDEVLNCAIEFNGDGVQALSMDQRMTISNMTTEWGALVGMFPCDEKTRAYLLDRASVMARRGDADPRLTPEVVDQFVSESPRSDPDAFYLREFEFDLSSVAPCVAGPNEVKATSPIDSLEKKRIKIDKAYLLSCVNSRLEDIAEAATVLEGKKIAKGVKMYLAAASAYVESQAQEHGYWQTLIDAGAIPLPPGCGPCIGLGQGLLEAGETAISATNRNFKGRMGSPDALAYLASPAVVAASAVAGYICSPPARKSGELRGSMTENERHETTPGKVAIRDGFPRTIEGRVLLIPKDNLNTDGIFGKEYTYKDDLDPSEMGKVAMLNYDPAFQQIAEHGDILVGGWNFGSGSSREQAATALKHRGIPLVIAGSFSQTYKRNAFNNAFIVIECPRLIVDLRQRYANRSELTIRTELSAHVDFESSRITVDGNGYPFSPLREVPQELIAMSGFEAVLRSRLKQA